MNYTRVVALFVCRLSTQYKSKKPENVRISYDKIKNSYNHQSEAEYYLYINRTRLLCASSTQRLLQVLTLATLDKSHVHTGEGINRWFGAHVICEMACHRPQSYSAPGVHKCAVITSYWCHVTTIPTCSIRVV